MSAAVEGADYVICVDGGPVTFKPGLMQNTVKSIVKVMQDHGVKRLIFQAGAFSPAPGTQDPFFVRLFLRSSLGRIFGISGMFAENDAIMAYLDAKMKDLDWTCTRPGQFENKPSKGELKPDGVRVPRIQVARLMRQEGQLQGASRRRHDGTTKRGAGRPAPDLVE